MRWRLHTVVLVAALAAVARGADGDARRSALEEARALVAEALSALGAERPLDAIELLGRARSVVPGEPVVAYDQGVAFAAAGELDRARDAYREALRQGTSSVDDVAKRARHNLGYSHLESARAVQDLLRTPGALESAVRAQGSPTGEPLTPQSVAMLAAELRGKALTDGLTNARKAIEVLRDSVRTSPDDGDAVRNLVLAQRVRRFLEEEQKRQQEQQSERQDDGDENSAENEKQDQQDGQGDQGESNDEGEDPQQKPSAGDEQKQDGEQKPGQDGESTDSDDSTNDVRQGEPRDIGREEAERLLEQLLDAASLKARQVERMRAERLRRGAVEKDW